MAIDQLHRVLVLVIMLVSAGWPQVFVLALGLRFLVVSTVQWVDVLLDGIPGGAPHLVDEVDNPDEE